MGLGNGRVTNDRPEEYHGHVILFLSLYCVDNRAIFGWALPVVGE